MRILAFTDIHENMMLLSRIKESSYEENVDLIVCAGDFTIFGRSVKMMIKSIDAIGKRVLLIHGNHEDVEEVSRLCAGTKNITFIHKRFVEIGGYKFVGLGGGGFRSVEPELELFDRENAGEYGDNTIIVSHAPPKNTALDMVDDDWHVGCETFTRIVKMRKPLLLICGHIHECFHVHDLLYGATLINPGPEGEIIELE